MENVQKEFINYQQYGELMDEFVQKLKDTSKEFNCIYGPPFGALPIITHLTKNLKKPVLSDDVIVTSRTDKQRNRDRKLGMLNCVLLVDDIADFGITGTRYIQKLKELAGFSNVFYATLFYKKHCTIIPDLYLRETSNWIVFPWEDPDEIPNR